MILRKCGNEWYIARRNDKSMRSGRYSGAYRNWFLIKHKTIIHIGRILFPEELAGKRIRLKVEVI